MFFHPNWHTHNRKDLAGSHKAIIKVLRRDAESEPTWSEEGGLVSGEDLLIYEGFARWQKVGYTTQRDFASDSAMFNRVRIQIDLKRFKDFSEESRKIHVNDRIVLVENDSNPSSEGSLVYVWGIPTSSNAWNITLNCQENFKQVAGD